MENGRKILYPVVLILLLFGRIDNGFGQTSSISKPDLELKDNKIKISYDIRNFDNSDRFNVWIEVTDSKGNPIKAKSLSGDVGNEIKGGSRKQITWNPDADGVALDVGIFVQVFAEIVKLPTEIDEPVESKVQEKSVNTGVLVLQSLALPGLGLTRATNGKPHWLRGVAGYGCIITSVTLNRMAISSYDDYQAASDVVTRDELFNKAKSQDNFSEVFAYAAIGVWVTDLVWTVVGASKMNAQSNGQTRGLTIRTLYDPGAQAPLLAFSYTF